MVRRFGADGSELVAVMRRSADAARDYAARHAVPRWYDDDADALILDEEVDVACIATPRRAPGSCPARRCGRQAVLRRKARRANHQKKMLRNGRGLRFVRGAASPWPLRRGLPRFLKAKELIDEGRIGRVTS